MLKNYLKIAIRQLLKHKLFSALNIFGLATSMSVCLLLIMIIKDQYSYDHFHENKNRIFRVISDQLEKNIPLKRPNYARTALSLAPELEEGYSVVEHAVRIAGLTENYQPNGTADKLELEGYIADATFNKVFSFGWKSGNQEKALETPFSIVLTEKTANTIFPDTDPLGRSLDLERGTFKVTGIIPDPPKRSHIQFDYLLSFSTIESLSQEERKKFGIWDFDYINRGLVYVLLKSPTDRGALDKALSDLADQHSERDPSYHYLFESQTLTDILPSKNLNSEIGIGTPKIVLYFLMALGIIIILSACFNYMNLTLARSLKRAKEIGIRKVAGAGRAQVFAQILGEAIITSLLALGIAIFLLEFLIPAFFQLDPFVGTIFTLDKTPLVYLVFFGFSLLVGSLAGLLPAINIAAFQPIEAIKESWDVQIFSKIGLRKVLITTQFTFSLIFILMVIMVLRQQSHVLQADLGLKTDNVLNVTLGQADYDVLADQVQQIPGVESVSASRTLIPAGNCPNTYAYFQDQKDSMDLSFNVVSPDYLENMDIQLVAGESFPDGAYSEQEQFILLNEHAVKRMGIEHAQAAVGQSLRIDGNNVQIIGVMKDFHYENIWFEPIRSFALRSKKSNPRLAVIALNTPDLPKTLTEIKSKWEAINPDTEFRATFTNDQAYDLAKFFRMGSQIIAFIGILSIIISCLGLLGMVIYTIEGKIKEVGIRKVLGASEPGLVWQLSKGFIWLLGISILIATPITIFGAQLWLQNFVIQMKIGPGIFVLGIGIVLFIGLLTVGSQTYFAAKSNPVNSLRQE